MTYSLKSSLVVIVLVLSACGKHSGFSVADYRYTRVDKLNIQKSEHHWTDSEPSTVERSSNRIHFKPTSSSWQNETLILKAQVQIDQESSAEVEFRGKKENSSVKLETLDPQFNEKLKAQLVCVSKSDNCDEFFIDVFYRDKDIIYHDQVLSEPKNNLAPMAVIEELKPIPTEKDSSADKDGMDEAAIDSIVDEGATGKAGYVGTSDEEVRKMFHIEKPEPEPPSSSNPIEQIKDWLKKLLERFLGKGRAIGSPSDPQGSLEEGIDFYQMSGLGELGFRIKAPEEKHHYGTYGLADLISQMGTSLKSILPERYLVITEISQLGGGTLYYRQNGKLKSHGGHRTGIDADIRYLRAQESLASDVVVGKGVSPNFLVTEQWRLIKAAFETDLVDVIFVVDPVKQALCREARKTFDLAKDMGPDTEILKRLLNVDGHQNHFHVRAKCTNKECKRLIYKGADKVGCAP